MKWIAGLLMLLLPALPALSQKLTVAQMKMEMEKSPNSPLYVKDVLKKKFTLDTVVVTRLSYFNGIADSLAYKGQIRKVYGPYPQLGGGRYLVQVLAKLPNSFNRISQIFIDTTVFRYSTADSLGKSILERIRNGSDNFEHLAQTYSMGGESKTKGDLGWVARGTMIPEIEKELAKRKKGEVFMVWSANGLHILKKTQDPKKDDGIALMMRVFL